MGGTAESDLPHCLTDDFRKDAFATGYHALICCSGNIRMLRLLFPSTVASDHQQ